MNENNEILVVMFAFVEQFTPLLGADALLPYVAQGIDHLERYANGDNR